MPKASIPSLKRRTSFSKSCIVCDNELNNDDFWLSHVFKISTSKSYFENECMSGFNEKKKLIFFNLFLRHNSGHVTKSQFCQCLQYLELNASVNEMQVFY